MELGNLEETREAYVRAKDAEQQQEQGENVVLVLSLPEQGEKKHEFKVGMTVQYVKAFIEQTYGLKMAQIVLKVAGKTLIDPLSLSDCPGIAGQQEVLVAVSTQ